MASPTLSPDSLSLYCFESLRCRVRASSVSVSASGGGGVVSAQLLPSANLPSVHSSTLTLYQCQNCHTMSDPTVFDEEGLTYCNGECFYSAAFRQEQRQQREQEQPQSAVVGGEELLLPAGQTEMGSGLESEHQPDRAPGTRHMVESSVSAPTLSLLLLQKADSAARQFLLVAPELPSPLE